MSAVWAGWAPAAPRRRARLRSVDAPAHRLARFPFLLVLIGSFGLGMAGLLMLNTTLQNQAFQVRSLSRQATELAYVQADLENQLDQKAAPAEIARVASKIGMRPNPHPAFLVLPEGRIIGKPTRVSGHEMPSLVIKTPEQLAAEQARKAERAAKARAVAEARRAAEEAKRAAERAAAQQAAAKKKQQPAAQKKKPTAAQTPADG